MNIAEDRILALAGMFQCTELVRQIARQGMVDQSPYESCISSILTLQAESTEAVYGGIRGVKIGLQVLCKQLEIGGQRNLEVMQYALGLILLERRLMKCEDMIKTLQTGIQEVIEQTHCHPVTHSSIITQLAQLYSNTLSTFDHRIQVAGEARFLENSINADKIRALLLAGIRSTVLWRQKGGNRWQFLFSRGKMVRLATQFLEQLEKFNPA